MIYTTDHRQVQITENIKTVSDLFKDYKDGQSLFTVTYTGDLFIADIIEYLAGINPPVSLDFSFWSVSGQFLNRLASMIDTNLITNVRMILDKSLKKRHVEVYDACLRLAGESNVVMLDNNLKFFIIRGENKMYAGFTSMNAVKNTRKEFLFLSSDSNFVQDFTSLFNNLFEEEGKTPNKVYKKTFKLHRHTFPDPDMDSFLSTV